MAEIWAVMEFTPIMVINPTQTGGRVKLVPILDPLDVKNFSSKRPVGQVAVRVTKLVADKR